MGTWIGVRRTLTVGSGTLSSGFGIYLEGANPLVFDTESHFSFDFLSFAADGPQEIPFLNTGYDGNQVSVIDNNTALTQTGTVHIINGGSLNIDGDGFTFRTATYTTDGYDLIVSGTVFVGAGADTDLKTFDIQNSHVQIGDSLTVQGSIIEQAVIIANDSTG